MKNNFSTSLKRKIKHLIIFLYVKDKIRGITVQRLYRLFRLFEN